MNLCYWLGVLEVSGLLCVVPPAPWQEQMVAALGAATFLVCFKSWMNQGMAGALLNSSKCITTTDVME